MRLATATVALSLILCTVVSVAAVHPKPKTHTVTMEGISYHPAVLIVKSGDTIVWVNKDLVNHSVTSAVGAFDSKTIPPGQSWKYTAPKKGDFPYGCTFHPSMKAMLHVE
jgi:plastocyanin